MKMREIGDAPRFSLSPCFLSNKPLTIDSNTFAILECVAVSTISSVWRDPELEKRLIGDT